MKTDQSDKQKKKELLMELGKLNDLLRYRGNHSPTPWHEEYFSL